MRYMGLGLGEDRRGEEDGREGGRVKPAQTLQAILEWVCVSVCVRETEREVSTCPNGEVT